MAAADIAATDAAVTNEATPARGLLRFSTAGSVDDGKSTLIGRLLYDSRGVYEDQLASVSKSAINRSSGPIDFSLITDGLRAEREQGITIDVAYRYFATARRKFIIADTPGHEQYTRNMATGASTADLAIVLVDARKGVLPQSRRHAFIASLLGIPRAIVAVNKMDLVGFSREVFERIENDFREFARTLDFRELRFIPISALDGDNVVSLSPRTPWYDGPHLLEYLETAPSEEDLDARAFRFPVQYVIRPTLDFRGYAGQVSSGTIRPGDPIRVLPSGRTSRVRSIVTYEGDVAEAFAPMSVTLTLEDELDISRGDLLARADEPAPVGGRSVDATVVWMNDAALELGRPYIIKQTTRQVRAGFRKIRWRVDVNTLAHEAARELRLNEIGVVALELQRPLFFDPYRDNRITGSFIVIDPITNVTLGAGMITGASVDMSGGGRVTVRDRALRLGHDPAIVAVPSRQDVALALERALFDQGCWVAVTHSWATAQTLKAAGLIAICTAADAAAAGIALTHRAAQVEDAVEELLQALDSYGVLHHGEGFSEGEGI
jgi:sulfate adenylyltransferase large subunit